MDRGQYTLIGSAICVMLCMHLSIQLVTQHYMSWKKPKEQKILAVLLPILGIGAFLWWAGRDILQGTCPNCGNEFKVFKSTLNNELQFCPFCSQPFSVEGNKFVRDPVKFSNQSSMFDQAFSNFSARKKKGKDSSPSVVDVEAEIRDAD